MERSQWAGAGRTRTLLLIILALFCGVVAWPVLQYAFTLWFYPYDWEVTDGDHLNVVVRILRGLVIYPRWEDGYITSVYSPLVHLIAAVFTRLDDISLLPLRTLSFLGFLLIVWAVFWATYRAHRETGKSSGASVITGLFFTLASIAAFPALTKDLQNIGPHSMHVALGLWAIVFASSIHLKKVSWLWISGFCVAAVFSKQLGVFAPFGILVALLVARRWRDLGRLLGFGVLIGLPLYFYFEWSNAGNFFRSVVIYVKAVEPKDGGVLWARVSGLGYKYGIYWIGTLLSAVVLWRAGNRFWGSVILISLLLVLLTYGNPGGDLHYLAPLWFLGFLSMGVASAQVLNTRPGFRSLQFVFLLLPVALMCRVVPEIYQMPRYRRWTHELSTTQKLVRPYYEFTHAQVKAGDYYLAARSASPFALAGGYHNYEMHTFGQMAWFKSPHLNRATILKEIAEQKFRWIATGIQAYPSEIQEAIDRYYLPTHAFTTTHLGFDRLIEVRVFEPAPKRSPGILLDN